MPGLGPLATVPRPHRAAKGKLQSALHRSSIGSQSAGAGKHFCLPEIVHTVISIARDIVGIIHQPTDVAASRSEFKLKRELFSL